MDEEVLNRQDRQSYDITMQAEPTHLRAQLTERRRNLRVIEECIRDDKERSEKLLAVRDFLENRIKAIEKDLSSLRNISDVSQEKFAAAY